MAKKYAINRKITYDGKQYTIHADDEVDFAVKKALKLKELEEGKVVINKSMTVREWAEVCLDTYRKPGVTEEYFAKYKSRMRVCILDIIVNVLYKLL